VALKAIETVYKGYRFRSRLEARWAVFLDALGLDYQYEHEGYDLDGLWYLPDFWVPRWDAFVEIKPELPTAQEVEKCRRLSRASGKRVLLFYGTPWEGEYKVALYSHHEQEFPWMPEIANWRILQCRRCENLFLVSDDVGGFSLGHPREIEDCRGCTDRHPLMMPELERALTVARQARFEDLLRK
jgi:hypothetical protein